MTIQSTFLISQNDLWSNSFLKPCAHLSTGTSWSSMVTSSLSSLFGLTSHNIPRAASLLASGSSLSMSTLCCKATFHPRCSLNIVKCSMYLSVYVNSLCCFNPCDPVYTVAKDRIPKQWSPLSFKLLQLSIRSLQVSVNSDNCCKRRTAWGWRGIQQKIWKCKLLSTSSPTILILWPE